MGRTITLLHPVPANPALSGPRPDAPDSMSGSRVLFMGGGTLLKPGVTNYDVMMGEVEFLLRERGVDDVIWWREEPRNEGFAEKTEEVLRDVDWVVTGVGF